MLKYDSCYHMGRVGTPSVSFNRFKTMSDALKATGKNILLNLCNWGEDLVHTVSTTKVLARHDIHKLTPYSGG
jgi:alpha-galactosidase